ncbi:hypothetical protein Cantr_00112 [Candida viswanathii]|uniref:Uncharacterized protein n=1 Tax=Candida viswanathii TaxID=5486 RepID=A0A367YFW6_9ASCO|nr:hypothetical protein Cantr_00112 [Candida viswanathii]
MKDLAVFIDEFGIYAREIKLKNALELVPKDQILSMLSGLINRLPISEVAKFIELFFRSCPKTVEHLTFHLTDQDLPNNAVMEFEHLRSIGLSHCDLSLFCSTPESLEKITVLNLDTTRGLSTGWLLSCTNVRCLRVGMAHAGRFSSIVGSLRKLESVRISEFNVIVSDQVGIPESIKELETNTHRELLAPFSLERFSQLKKLTLFNTTFPEGLFHGEGHLPVLAELIFVETTESQKLHGHFHSLRWQPPQSVRELAILHTWFRNGFNVKLPPDLFYLHIADTNLFDLDNVQFPTGLRELTIWHNCGLTRMLNTNLKELTQLVKYLVVGNDILVEFDTPDDKLGCRSSYLGNGAHNSDDT